jgi:hypothetical protein
MRAALTAAGAVVLSEATPAFHLDVAADRLRAIARIPGIQAIEKIAVDSLSNQRAGIIVGANQVRNLGNVDFLTNLDGTGEIVHVIDSGLDNGAGFAFHPDIAGRVGAVQNMNNPAFATADFHDHGTHVTGTILGNGAQAIATPAAVPNPSVPRGMAPAATVWFHSAINVAAPPGGAGAPLSFMPNFIPACENAFANGARVHNNSFGRNSGNAYNAAVSAVIDRFAFLRPESVVLFSSDNNETDANGNGVLDMNLLGNQAVAKNVLVIGACENDTNVDGLAGTYPASFAGAWAHANFAAAAGPAPVAGNFPISDNPNELALFSERGRVSTGPVARRRIKPDLVAPGTNVVSLRRVALPAAPPPAPPPMGAPVAVPAATAPAAFYHVLSGTSMATPVVSGCCALVRQFYRTRFGEMRRPLLLETLAAFVDRPAMAAHRDGIVIAWVRERAPGTNDIVAARFSEALVRLGPIVVLDAGVGPRPAPALARSGDNTLLLYRGADNNVRLRLFDGNLAAVAGFGTGGTVTLAPGSRPEDDRRPALCVRGGEVAVTWIESGTENLLFRRFRTDTGAAIDGAAVTLGSATGTSGSGYLIHNGSRYAAVWARSSGGAHQVLLRFVANNGTPAGTAPVTLRSQPQAIREPHIVWNPRPSRYRVVWVSDDAHAGGDVISQRFNASGSADPAQPLARLISVAATQAVRRPQIVRHPDAGYALFWEDNSQNTHDVYMTFLSEAGALDGRISGNRLRLSDTPNDTAGHLALGRHDGFSVTWLSNDEINSDVRAGYVLHLTLAGAFRAQADPNVPLLDSGRYVPHVILQHASQTETGVAMTWAGGPFFLLRSEAPGVSAELMMVRTTADGLPDAAFGAGGARRIAAGLGFDGLAVMWAGTRLMAVSTFDVDASLFLFDADGTPEATFGTAGVRDLGDRTSVRIFPQLGFDGTGNTFRMFVAWGRHADPTPFLRIGVLNRQGAFVVAPRDLNRADGTSRHGWFHWVSTETGARAIAVWHERVGANLAIRLNRYNPFNAVAAMPQHTPPIALTAIPGDSQNAVLAPRPVNFAPPFGAGLLPAAQQREYGLAWQNLPAAAGRWEIRFSRINRNGTVSAAVRDVAVIQDPADHATDPQLVWHTDGYGLAWLQQPAGGGPHRLMFTTLDQNGAAGPNRHQISRTGADVRAFQLVWGGRSFRVTWTETEGAVIRHMQSAGAVPRTAPAAGFDRPYRHPSSALVRATLINGATNVRNTPLPNVPTTVAATHNPHDGYGWGRVNMRQSLAPRPPVTFHVRDDGAVGPGRTARYAFVLPPETQLLRVTLAWTDPPGNNLVNVLNLRVTTPAFPPGPARTYVGNRWRPNGESDPLPTPPPANPFQQVHPVEQIVVRGAPTLPAGRYVVEVIGTAFNTSRFQQFPGQAFALVIVGSGAEWALVAPAAIGPALPFY